LLPVFAIGRAFFSLAARNMRVDAKEEWRKQGCGRNPKPRKHLVACRAARAFNYRSMTKQLIAILMLGFGSANFLSAATYYGSKTGRDSNNGSQAAPWLTVQKAANSMSAGDTVNIGAGSYEENVSVGTSGTAASRITYNGPGNVRRFSVTGSYVTIA